jgi:ribonuclease P/MRP protein subunit POP7
MGKIDLLNGPGNDRDKVRSTGRGRDAREKGKEPEEVLVKATGKAIEKALRIALYFQGQEDCAVRLRTGSVGAVDDVLVKERGEEGEEDVPETRIRMTSMLEVGISLR